jgi:hypothetical protein
LNIGEFLARDFGRYYRVPLDRAEEFRELHSRLEPIYRTHALSWSLRRSRLNPEDWRESGPSFREHADLEAAAGALAAHMHVLEAIAAFELDRPIEVGPTASFWSTIERETDFETIFQIGERFGWLGSAFERPIDPERMTNAMRRAHALARELAARLDPAVPEGYSVTATNETIAISDRGRPITWLSLVDMDIVEAVEVVLELVQDELAEETTVPWPHDPKRGYKFHEPHADIEDGAVHAWYGPRRTPVLELEPIPLAVLTA